MSLILNQIGGWSFMSASANGTGSAFDARAMANLVYVYVECTGNSAIVDIKAGPDTARLTSAAAITATNGGTGTAVYTAYWPYFRADARSVYSAAGGSAVVSVYMEAAGF